MREDAPFQHKLRATMQTKRGRASRRKRTAVAPAIAHQLAPQGGEPAQGAAQKPCDGRRHAAVSNLLVAARYEEERQLAS